MREGRGGKAHGRLGNLRPWAPNGASQERRDLRKARTLLSRV